METLKSLNGSTFRWSLPCDVNSSVVPARGYQFLEEARKTKAMKDKEYTAIDMESLETQRLLDHDTLAQNYEEEEEEEETQEVTIVPKFTSRATLQISATPVDDPIPFHDLDSVADSKKPYDVESLSSKVMHSKYSVYIPTYRSTTEEKKVDENGNALHQNSASKPKKKKVQDKNVVVRTAESVEGHRGDIINDVDKLMQFIGGGDKVQPSKAKSNVHKSKQLKQHSEESVSQKKKQQQQRMQSSKGKETRSELKKSNSLGEISTTKLEDFAFADKEEKVVLRGNKPGHADRPKERRSWGNVDPPPFQILSSNTSVENVDVAGNWMVTKPKKKKSKRRRNSISNSGGGRRQNSVSESNEQPMDRIRSSDLRAKSTCSVPHSEKSNDSSDSDSVHSLPIDGLNVPISYADIAKNSEKLKEVKKVVAISPEKPPAPTKEPSPPKLVEAELVKPPPTTPLPKKAVVAEKAAVVVVAPTPLPVIKAVPLPAPPDVNNLKSFPAMPQELAAPVSEVQEPLCEAPKLVEAPQPRVYMDMTPTLASLKTFIAVCPEAPVNPPSEEKAVADNAAAPPDVHSIKSFPAMPNPGSQQRERTGPPGGKVRSVSPPSHKAGGVYKAIQNDLALIHSNEKESIQFNAQMLPPDIPDVRTIEKLQFMSLPLAKQPQGGSPAPPGVASQAEPPSAAVPFTTATSSSPAAPVSAAAGAVSFSAAMMAAAATPNCDKGEERTCESLPPVVILSGLGNKEVPGLVFGFDVNEQLLNEDICENFVARYVAPENFRNSTHNHDKIVNFIGSAWEAIISQSNGKVQYYKEES